MAFKFTLKSGDLQTIFGRVVLQGTGASTSRTFQFTPTGANPAVQTTTVGISPTGNTRSITNPTAPATFSLTVGGNTFNIISGSVNLGTRSGNGSLRTSSGGPGDLEWGTDDAQTGGEEDESLGTENQTKAYGAGQ